MPNDLTLELCEPAVNPPGKPLNEELRSFCTFGRESTEYNLAGVPVFVNEFWTAKQRDASSLHEVSYRACFKPQLPRFFIERLTSLGDTVYDPFMGRGTTLIEAALTGRVPLGCDVNPLSTVLVAPRLEPPEMREVAERLTTIDRTHLPPLPDDLLAFYHPDTLTEICALREHFIGKEREGTLDRVDRWIRMVSVNRLTGHSPGFFSVYTMPPNQAVSAEGQRKINARRKQVPPKRDIDAIILRKSQSLLKDCRQSTRRMLALTEGNSRLLTGDCASTPAIAESSVKLVVTSPPFLDVVDYAKDNWLRCWFCGIDPRSIHISVIKGIDAWRDKMRSVFAELERVLVPGGHIAFEVGEVRNGKVRLEEVVLEAVSGLRYEPVCVMVNEQDFTKTANCWGVSNNTKGTNTNRIVVLKKV